MGLRDLLITASTRAETPAASFFDVAPAQTPAKAAKPDKARKTRTKAKDETPTVAQVEESLLQTSIARPVGASDKNFFSPASSADDQPREATKSPAFCTRLRAGRGRFGFEGSPLELSTHRTRMDRYDPALEAAKEAEKQHQERRAFEGLEWLSRILSFGSDKR